MTVASGSARDVRWELGPADDGLRLHAPVRRRRKCPVLPAGSYWLRARRLFRIMELYQLKMEQLEYQALPAVASRRFCSGLLREFGSVPVKGWPLILVERLRHQENLGTARSNFLVDRLVKISDLAGAEEARRIGPGRCGARRERLRVYLAESVQTVAARFPGTVRANSRATRHRNRTCSSRNRTTGSRRILVGHRPPRSNPSRFSTGSVERRTVY